MTSRSLLLVWSVLVTSTGCGWLLEDYSGVLCNPDGTCPTGYFCQPATGRCETGEGPGQQGGDGGVCSGVSACTAGDGCCPAGCHANNDSDCKAVCGNGQVEASGGELCDDGNTLNGDNCDPTCRYFNGVSLLSGVPGSRGYSDGPRPEGARFQTASHLALGAGSLFVVDEDNATVVRMQPQSGGTSGVVAGSPLDRQYIDGPVKNARFVQPEDAVYFDDSLYLMDRLSRGDAGLPQQTLRRVSLDGGVVETVDAGLDLVSLRALGRDSRGVLLLGDRGLGRWEPSTGAKVQLATGEQLADVAGVGNPCEAVAATAFDPATYYLACKRVILQVSGSDGTVSIYSGNPTTYGCSEAQSDGGPALYYNATGIALGTSRAIIRGITVTTLYVADQLCHTLRFAPSGLPYAGLNFEPGYLDGPATVPFPARFNKPTSVVSPNDRSDAGVPLAYVADLGNVAVRQLTGNAPISSGSTLSLESASTLAGAPANTVFAYTDAGTEDAGVPPSRYLQVTDLSADGDAGVVYALSQSGGRVFQVSLDTGTSSQLEAGLSGPVALTRFEGALYVATTNGTIRKLVPGSPSELYAGRAGTTSPAVDGDRKTSAVLSASALTTDGKSLFFVDDKARSLRKVDPLTGFVTTLAGGESTGSGPLDGVGRAARFDSPRGLASDGTFLYTLDAAGLVVRRVLISTGEVTTLAGQAGQAGAVDAVGTAARFAGARDLTTDGHSLFITDPEGARACRTSRARRCARST